MSCHCNIPHGFALISRLSEVLSDLMTVSEVPFTAQSSSKKRPRNDAPIEPDASGASPNDAAEGQPRSLAGSRRAHAYEQQQQQAQQHVSPASSDSTDASLGEFVLPQHTEELGNMPLHPGIPPWSDSNGNPWSGPFPFPEVGPPGQAANNTFSDLPANGAYPDGFLGAFAAPGQVASGSQLPPLPSNSNEAYYPAGQQTMAAAAENSLTNMMATVSMDPTSSMFTQPSDADTLAMWSTAPTSFE